jgi:hypothetical protein
MATLMSICFIALSSPASAKTSATTSTYVLYVGHGVGVVATFNPSTGCSEVFSTNDFTHWRNISPPLKNEVELPKGQCPYVWTDAYFTSSSDGWLLARNGGSTDTLLRHTIDGEGPGSRNRGVIRVVTPVFRPSPSSMP